MSYYLYYYSILFILCIGWLQRKTVLSDFYYNKLNTYTLYKVLVKHKFEEYMLILFVYNSDWIFWQSKTLNMGDVIVTWLMCHCHFRYGVPRKGKKQVLRSSYVTHVVHTCVFWIIIKIMDHIHKNMLTNVLFICLSTW